MEKVSTSFHCRGHRWELSVAAPTKQVGGELLAIASYLLKRQLETGYVKDDLFNLPHIIEVDPMTLCDRWAFNALAGTQHLAGGD